MPTFTINLSSDPPSMTVEVSAETVIENQKTGFSVDCMMIDGNPADILFNKWFIDDIAVKVCPEGAEENDSEDYEEFLECDSENIESLHVKTVNRVLAGNWSCSGSNSAGMSDISLSTYLTIQCMY